jgi:WD40 repeat protein/DNA-binding SARP family transcriptional activator
VEVEVNAGKYALAGFSRAGVGSPWSKEVNLRLLGPVEASVDDQPVAIGAGKARALLAMLALNEGAAVSSEALIDGLWGEDPPATANKMVQVYVSQLRKAFRNGGGNGAEILTRVHGYELRLGDGEVDARRFERLLADGEPRRALALWRGPPLDDVATEPFAGLEIRRLEELHLTAIERALEQDLAAGRNAEVIAEVQTVLAGEPLRERLHAVRMLALYRSGRQADALGAYRRARDELVNAIGVEPGPELRRLHEAILRQDPALDLPMPAELPPELDLGTSLVGREDELEALREFWRRAKAGGGAEVLVAGAPGIGKTRLAAELAAEVHADGGHVLYASAGSSEAALRVIEQARAARRPTLLVVDDADHAAGEVGAELGRLAVAGRPLLVLATAEHGGDATITLRPVAAAAVEAIAREYGDAPPLDQLLEESAGVPQRVHRTASRWARRAAVLELEASADRAAGERARLQRAEDDLTASVVRVQAASTRAAPPTAPAPVACPFKGLASFEVDDADVFFGRERLVAEIVARLAGAPLLGIVGPSGSGKSSALKAGLLPALANGVLPGSDGWSIALLRPGAHPIATLESATRDTTAVRRPVIAVDQFEELFTACHDEAERAAFAGALIAAVRDPRRRALVLIAMRADFYGRCASYPELWRMLGAAHVTIGPMRRDELRRAILLPAQRAGLRVDDALVDALVGDVAGEPGALPLLSTALLELWQQRDGARLAFPAYDRAGGVHGAVARLAERVYGELTPDEQPVARTLLERLAGMGDEGQAVRRRLPLAELQCVPQAAGVLGKLADGRLVSVSQDQAEVAHEALLREWPRLRGWLEEDAEGRRLHHHLGLAAREWDARGRDPGELYRGARLAAALDWSAAHDPELGDAERAFLDASRAAATRSQRRLRAVLGVVAALLVLAVAAGLVALQQSGTAGDRATVADAQRLGSRALTENDLDRSLLLARQGVALDDSPQTRGNLLAALIKSPAAIGVMRGVGERFSALALSPNGHTLAAADPAGNVFLFDTRTRKRVTAPDVHPGGWEVVGLAYAPDGKRLAVAHDVVWQPDQEGHAVTLVDTRNGKLGTHLALDDFEREISGIRFAGTDTVDVASVPEGLAAGPRTTTVERFDARTGERILGPLPVARATEPSPLIASDDGSRVLTLGDDELTLRDARTLVALRQVGIGHAVGHQGQRAVALSPDGRTVAVGETDGAVRFVDLPTGAVRRASGRHGGPVTAARFTSDGASLVTTSEDGDAIVWDVRARAVAETLSGHAHGIAALELTADGRTLYTAGLDGSIFLWDLTGTRRLGQPFEAGGPSPPLAALSSDGRRLAIGQRDGVVSVMDFATPARRREFAVILDGGSEIDGLAFVPGSRLLVVGSSPYTRLLDTDSGRVVRRLDSTGGWDRAIPGPSRDGKLLATKKTVVGSPIEVDVWSIPDGRRVAGPVRLDHEVFDVQLTPDGQTFVVVLANAGYESGWVEAWDVLTSRRLRRLALTRLAAFMGFSPDGSRFALGNRYGESRIYETATFKPVTRVLAGDAGAIIGAAITPDNRTLATGSEAGAVQLWDIRSGQALGAPLPGVSSSAVKPAFTPDGGHLVATYATGRAYLWDIQPASLAKHACDVAGRRLTRAEWRAFLPGRKYDPAC